LGVFYSAGADVVEGIAVLAACRPICTRRRAELPAKGWAFVDGPPSGHGIKIPVERCRQPGSAVHSGRSMSRD
jgi:hypothetical protein